MSSRYIRNRIYLSENEQEAIKNFPIFLGGAGIGSVIAECALRIGFENITIVDGDSVERSNLNRQNYIENDIGSSKVESLKTRLESINPEARISTHNVFIDEHNVEHLLKDQKVVINALDFTTEIPLILDEVCQNRGIPVIHPYNLGWAGLVLVIGKNGKRLDELKNSDESFNELNVVEYAINYLKNRGNNIEWLQGIIDEYKSEELKLSPPQLSVASWMVASMCSTILVRIATGKSIKIFPELYFSSTE